MSRVVNAMMDIGPVPCEACVRRLRCGQLKLACTAFAEFINERPWNPEQRGDETRRRWTRIYNSPESPPQGGNDEWRAIK